ncbi:MAG: DUF1592 domain-containing protein [Myxococcales bacterium]|nr:DUF1592 domain-containing protein [Myxococcales bacterium]
MTNHNRCLGVVGAAVAVLGCLAACEAEPEGFRTPVPTAGAAIESPQATTPSGGATPEGNGAPSVAEQTADGDSPGASPPTSSPDDPRIEPRIWRLTPDQLNRAVRDLFGDGAPAMDVPESAAEAGFTNIAANAVVDLGNASQFDSGVRAVGQWVTEQREASTRCRNYEGDTCIDELLAWLLPDAFRRPVEASETADVRRLYSELKSTYDQDYAIAGVVRAVLLSPEFLYRSELGDAGATLTPHEIANLLAFAMTDRGPDAALLEAAARSNLADPDVREAQARRLIDQSGPAWQRFFWEWLALETLHSQGTEVGLESALVDQMEEEYRAFVSNVVVAQKGTLRDLLSASYSWMRPELAAHYGVAHPGGGLARVELDPNQRGGLLTQGAWLVSHGKAGHDNVVRRGMNLFKQAMCNNKLAPPEGLDVNAALLSLVGPDATVRETVEARSSAPSCGGCHMAADRMGVIFENYGSDGRWQSTYADGHPVESAISLSGLGDFELAPEFAAALADDKAFQHCFVRRVVHYLMGIDMGSPRSAAWVKQAHQAFVEADTSLEALLIAIVRHPAFVERVPEESP